PPGNLVLKINNSYRLGDTRRVFAQARQGLIPLLLHPRPRRMLFLGVGTGGSAGAAAAHGGVDIDALEILPDLQDVLHHFRKSNFGFLERVRQEEGVRFLVVDARHFVQATERRYDVVVGDLFVPWRAGEGAMYTHAHFRAVRDVLDEGGLFCQWLPLYQLGPRELRIITATFCDVFPEASAWWLYFNAEQPALALVGSLRPQALDVSSLSQRLAVADRGELFKAAGLLDPAELLGSRICGRPALVDWSEQAPLETRAHPRIEFIAPWQRFRPTTDRTQEQLDSMFAITEPFDPALLSGAAPGMVQSVHGIQAALPHFLKGQRAQLADGDEARAAAAYADALAEGPEWALLQRMVLRRASDALLQERFDLLERCGAALARTRAHAHRGYYYMARAQYARGETETARRALQEALRIRPGDAGSLRLLEQIEQGG
ncbi:MAG: hypothetical protein O7C98_04820, partial [Planctomycetota bacterium]|nr:hypothetical protein [Planctomycetota bacterium]